MVVGHDKAVLGYDHTRAGTDLLPGHRVSESEEILKQRGRSLRLLAPLDHLYKHHGVDRRLRRICEIRIFPGYAYVPDDSPRISGIVHVSLLPVIRGSHSDSNVTCKSAGYYGGKHYQPIFLSHILSIFLGFEQD